MPVEGRSPCLAWRQQSDHNPRRIVTADGKVELYVFVVVTHIACREKNLPLSESDQTALAIAFSVLDTPLPSSNPAPAKGGMSSVIDGVERGVGESCFGLRARLARFAGLGSASYE